MTFVVMAQKIIAKFIYLILLYLVIRDHSKHYSFAALDKI